MDLRAGLRSGRWGARGWRVLCYGQSRRGGPFHEKKGLMYPPSKRFNNVSESRVSIGPETRVATLLDDYPELEEVLIAMAPPFEKLRNPILRRSVAKVASLKQAAAVAGLPVGDVVNALRHVVDQEAIEIPGDSADTSYFGEEPGWFRSQSLVCTLEERDIDPDTMALTKLLDEARKLQSGEMLVLITDFLPAPGIDIIRKRGFLVWATRAGGEVIRTYVSAP